MSLESFIKDLQDLNKENTLITKKELEAMKTKMKKLEKENAKLKADLSAKDVDLAEKEEERLFYDRNFHQNVKELSKIKAENKILKAEIASLKTSTLEEDMISESSSFQFMFNHISINVRTSDDGDETPIAGHMLAIYDENKQGLTSTPKVSRKRSRLNDDTETSIKTPKSFQTISPMLKSDFPWKCFVCNAVRFEHINELRSHLQHAHPMKPSFVSDVRDIMSNGDIMALCSRIGAEIQLPQA